jgi:hypothetical protein
MQTRIRDHLTFLYDMTQMYTPERLGQDFRITKTNVPHEENISYFGDPLPETGGTDEAQMVYQFPLPPGDAQPSDRQPTGDLRRAAGLEVPSEQATSA